MPGTTGERKGSHQLLRLPAHGRDLGFAAASPNNAIIGPLTAVVLPVIEPAFAMAIIFFETAQVLYDHISLLDEYMACNNELTDAPADLHHKLSPGTFFLFEKYTDIARK